MTVFDILRYPITLTDPTLEQLTAIPDEIWLAWLVQENQNTIPTYTIQQLYTRLVIFLGNYDSNTVSVI